MHIATHTMEKWARRFLSDLKTHASAKHEDDFVSIGFGLDTFRMVGMGQNFKASCVPTSEPPAALHAMHHIWSCWL